MERLFGAFYPEWACSRTGRGARRSQRERAGMKNPKAWVPAMVLSAVLLVGVGLLGVSWLKAYHVARHQGRGADLKRALLLYAPLRGAELERADLTRALLGKADLSHTGLRHADLTHANLRGANLGAAMVCYVSLRDADLRGASFESTILFDVDLRQARLHGADLRHTNLNYSKLTGATYDRHTRWPFAFDPKKHGAILVK
jgi:uncharacterized protein YjbI with pentapeptide repeats